MRELERTFSSTRPAAPRVAVIGRGRLGTAIAAALGAAGLPVSGPLGRGATPAPGTADVVLLCVPDGAIADVAAEIAPGPLVGHCSGASGLDRLPGHEAFSLHPLMTFTGDAGGTPATPGPDAVAPGADWGAFAGVGAAVSGTTDRALATAIALADHLGMHPFTVAEQDRALYHAAASVASNYLIALEATAERLAEAAGCDRAQLIPLVRATVENWARLGPERALTGPVARGDTATVARQRTAIERDAPDVLALFDALTAATATLASRRGVLA